MTDGVAQLGRVLGCADPERLAEFFAPALGNVNLGPTATTSPCSEVVVGDGTEPADGRRPRFTPQTPRWLVA